MYCIVFVKKILKKLHCIVLYCIVFQKRKNRRNIALHCIVLYCFRKTKFIKKIALYCIVLYSKKIKFLAFLLTDLKLLLCCCNEFQKKNNMLFLKKIASYCIVMYCIVEKKNYRIVLWSWYCIGFKKTINSGIVLFLEQF